MDCSPWSSYNMCGIAGIVDWNGEVVQQQQLQQMTDAIRHRGPDGEGFFVDQNVGLGHRRLAIIDLSDAAQQPFCIDDLVLVYNGEIYNYIELRQELQQLGYRFTTQSDSEVLLRSYQHWGKECLIRFNGMWAFAIYHKKDNTLFCSRDRFGVKPFYYTICKQQFVFCSEIKGILVHTQHAAANIQAVMDYLVTGKSADCSNTFFDQIFSLPAGHFLFCNATKAALDIKPYYRIRLEPMAVPLNSIEAVALLQTSLKESISFRLRSDVKVGTCLSGGLDSSTIAHIAATQQRTVNAAAFTAVTALSVQPNIDESAYAQQMVQQEGLHWVSTKPCTADFLATLEDVVLTQEEPFASPSVCMQYFVMQAAQQSGVKVLLDGQGADEVLLGYTHYAVTVAQQMPLKRRPAFLWQAFRHSGLSAATFIKNYVFVAYPALRLRQQRKRWPHLKPLFANKLKAVNTAPATVQSLQLQELLSSSLPALLRYEDKNSMRFGIETRLPFLDWRLVEAMINVPDALKFEQGWSKHLLRQAVQGNLPHSLVWRKKKLGFAAPEQIWLQDWKVFEAEVMGSALLKSIFSGEIPFKLVDSTGKWRLVCLAKWEKLYNLR